MDLKELLGEELYQQVMEKAGSHKLAVVNDGQWFPKEKFDQVNNDNKELKDQLKDRDNQLKDLSQKAQGNAELQKQIQTLQQKNEDTAKEYQAKLDAQSFDYALSDALRGAKARNPKAVKALLNTEAIKLDGDKLLGLDEQLKVLQESDAYLFEAEEAPGLKGRNPNPGNPNDPPIIDNPFRKDSFNMTKQGQLIKQDPDKARDLITRAGGNPALYGL